MISKRLEEIGESDLDHLLANDVTEGKTIEYKKVLPGNSDSDKKEFLADVSSFANTTGGDLIFGIDEAQGAPVGIPGLVLSDPDLEVRRLDSIISDGLEPRIRFATRVIQRNGSLPALVVRTERSWIGPHRVIFKGHDKFYARNSAGKYPMDVSELRSAFTLAGSVTEQVRRFRADRLARLSDNKPPVALMAGLSHTVLHCIPLESFSRTVQYDVLKYSQQTASFPPLSRALAGVTGSTWTGLRRIAAASTVQWPIRNCLGTASSKPLRPIGLTSTVAEAREPFPTLLSRGEYSNTSGSCSTFRKGWE